MFLARMKIVLLFWFGSAFLPFKSIQTTQGLFVLLGGLLGRKLIGRTKFIP